MRNNVLPTLTLVGAGPGDPDLITVKGIKALRKADVVLYDALVNPELLMYAPNARKIYVGKRRGNHSFNQDEINKLIVRSAYKYGHVVRLKGGDPFIFGRGAEELKYAELFGLNTDIVVGLSSSTAVPGNAGISLTERGVSESIWVITGTTRKGSLSKDVALAAGSTATVVILMGMQKLPEIVYAFQNENRGDTPAAIIQEGTSMNEKIGIGVIDSIEEIVDSQSLSSPAIIVVGEVVKNMHRSGILVHKNQLTDNSLKSQFNYL